LRAAVKSARAFNQVAAELNAAFAVPTAQAATAMIAVCRSCTGTGNIDARIQDNSEITGDTR
jgi:hypothetical protein